LEKSGLKDLIEFQFMKNRVSATSVVHKPDKKTMIILRDPVKYWMKKIIGVFNHEIGTHCIWWINDVR
jgi:hypothetical protein